MPDRHARLSASSSYRWLNCPASVSYGEGFSDKQTQFSLEGTLAHAVAERGLKTNSADPDVLFNFASKESKEDKYKGLAISDPDLRLMSRYVAGYIRYVREKMSSVRPSGNPKLYVERCISYSDYAPGGFGTTDCTIVSDERLIVIDFKYGKGVTVEAEGNTQMALYALGWLSCPETPKTIKEIETDIYQPRTPGRAEKEAFCKPEDLIRWGMSIKGPAEDAYTGIGDFRAGDWCRFCKGGPVCRERLRFYAKQLKGFIKNE